MQSYSYTGWGNRLRTVTGDASRSYTPVPSIVEGYDANGNVLTDGNGNTFTYNHLHLPGTVTGGNAASYSYDATGRKLARAKGGISTYYIDGIQYTGGTIDFVQTEEGIARRNANGSYAYEYNLTDHLGNVRVSFDISNNAARRIQSDDYYPFGKTFGSYVLGAKNNYLYNGKELQEGLEQYDYGARFYDPVIGRWGVVDPLAEKRDWLSPYNYVQNNPLNRIDPTGALDEYREEVDEDGNVKRTKISDLGGDEVDFTHIKGGDHDGQMRIKSRGSGKELYARTSEGVEGYTHREKGITWNAIYDEFLNGTGPENSLITTAGMTQE